MLKLIPSAFAPSRRSRAPLALSLLAAVAGTVFCGPAYLRAQAPVVSDTTSAPTQSVAVTPTVLPSLSSANDTQFSSSVNAVPALLAEGSTNPLGSGFANAMQYGGGQRSRTGRPRYRGGHTNADGSSKFTFLAGAGFAQPVGNTYKYFTPSYGFQVGVGPQFSKHFAIPIQFDYDHLGLAGSTIGNQQTLYNNDTNYYCNQHQLYCQQNGISDFTTLDGNAHVWSFTVNPTYTFYQSSTVGAYVVAGVGFYHKVTNFTTPTQGVAYDPYYGYYSYTANATVDHYTSNAPGFNGGFGLTYKFSRFSNERLFGEIRYVFVDNSQRQGVTVYSPVNNTTVAATNDFPANSNRTSYFPVKFGIRF